MSEVFDDLFVEKDELNDKILKDILSGRIKMTSEGDIIFEKDFEPKTAILLHLLANKVFLMKKIKENEAEGPRNIHLKTGVAEGTVKKYVRDLQKERLLISKGGKYFVPNHALTKVSKLVNENDKRS